MIEPTKEWLAEPINCTCEVMVDFSEHTLCDRPTTAAYPSRGGGWMSLCGFHSRKHLPKAAYLTEELISKGAAWK